MAEFLQNLIDALSLGSLYALVALGIGLLFGILRLINFAQGDYITIGCYALIVPSTDVTARMLIGAWSWPALIPAICLIVIVAALLTDALIFRPLRRASSPTLMIASFAVSYIIQNGILMIYGSRPKAVNLWSELNTQILVGGLRLPLLQIVTIVVTLVLMLALTLFLKRTRVGMQMRAAAEDFRMAQYLGVRANVVIGLAFAISGMLAAVVSFLYLTQSGSLEPRDGRAIGPVCLCGGRDRRHGKSGGVGRRRVFGGHYRNVPAGLSAAGLARFSRRVRVRGRHLDAVASAGGSHSEQERHRTGMMKDRLRL